MTAHHLGMDCVSYIVDGEIPALARHLRIKNDLKQQIAKLVTQFGWTAFARFLDRFKRFVGFFQKHGRQRRVRLFTIPRTTTRGTQTIHQFNQISKSFRHRG